MKRWGWQTKEAESKAWSKESLGEEEEEGRSRRRMVSQSGTGAGRRVLLQSLEVCSCQIPREEEGRVRAVCSAPRCELQGSVTSW